MARHHHKPSPRTRLFLVDDQPIVRRGLRLLCGVNQALEVCGEAAGEHDALARILALRPDLVIVDLTLKEGSGLALIKQLHRRCPTLKILVFSMHAQAHFATGAFAAGARGYVLKEEGSERVLEAIQVIRDGGYYLSERMAARVRGLASRSGPHARTRAT